MRDDARVTLGKYALSLFLPAAGGTVHQGRYPSPVVFG
jgi:hypothetical protein